MRFHPLNQRSSFGATFERSLLRALADWFCLFGYVFIPLAS